MQSYSSDQLRNVVLMGHGGTGKTTLTEAMLYASGATSRMGSVENGNTVSDFDDQERAHQYSISASLVPVEWDDARVNLIDAPGYPDFEGEVVAAAAAADAAIITVDGVAGVHSGTETAWRVADQAGTLPRLIVVTRLDRENSSFDDALSALRERFGAAVVPLAIPIGEASGFEGSVGLLRQTARRGADGAEEDAPAELTDAIASAREMLVESVAETDDDLLNQYLEGEEISVEALATALAAAIKDGVVYPVLPVSATTEIGVRYLLDRIVELLPSPLGREHSLEDGAVTTAPDGAFVGRVFKTTADPFVGRLTYLKVLSGTLTPDANPWNVQRATAERLGHLYLQRGKEQIEVPELVAGDIGVAAKLNATLTGDTFVASQDAAVTVSPLVLPEPTYRSALHPRSKDDVDKLSSALARIIEQDPTIHVERDAETAELVMTTVGDAQALIAASRLEKSYQVGVDIAAPRVPYRETVTAPAKAEYKHKKQSGGHGQYGHVVLEVGPVDRGAGVTFEEKVVGGNVPRQFIPAVEKGVMETIPRGPLASSPVVDVRVTLLDGSAHSVDSSEIAFKIAASQALRQGVMEARPILLEPVMQLRIRVPSEFLGDVMSDLNGRRGQAHGVQSEGPYSVVEADAPLAEVQRYITDVRALTQGRGSFSLSFDRYAEVPTHVQAQVLKELEPAEA